MTGVPAAEAQDVIADLARQPADQRVRAEAALVADLVDAPYYVLTNASTMDDGEGPAEHFCRVGWQALRKPSPDFDVWWYWMNHLDPAVDDVNPLVHYALVGRELGLSTRPMPSRPSPDRPRTSAPTSRAVLFAGFDLDGVVDESVLLLVAELARHADVFYLCDGYLAPEELAKLDGITAGAWAVRHGAYDFGSYSMLARELVGWDRLETYDEVLFVNDSCFLVRPLDEVFAEMGDRDCDWWGLQATKGLSSTREQPGNDFSEAVPIDEVRTRRLADYESDTVYDFHLGSYFLAFRRPVLDDPVFRRLVDSVHEQPGKLLVILKYEVGLTHLLVGRGHLFDTYVPALHPFHPLFTETHFALIEAGFPLLKRYFIYQNHYDVPGLAHWKERVLAAAPGAPVETFEATLRRTAPDDRLQRSMAITETAPGTVHVPEVVRGRVYRRRSEAIAKRPDVWTFAVDPVHHLLPEGSRAIFEAVRDDASITKVLLTRTRRVELPGTNVVVEPLLSPAGREQLMRSGLVVVGPATHRTLESPSLVDRQVVVAARDGLVLERSDRSSAVPDPAKDGPNGPIALLHEAPRPVVTALLVASDVDRVAALATQWPCSFDRTWMTGLPSHDLLLAPAEALPADYREQLARLHAELAGRRLLLLLPAAPSGEPHTFSQTQREHLRAWARRHDAVIGVREDVRDLRRPYWAQLGDHALDLSPRRYPAQAAVLRSASAVLTDHAGAALDFAVTGRPVLSFAHDPTAADRLLLDLDHTFPGPVAHDFDELAAALDGVLDDHESPRARRARTLLLGHPDGASTQRVLQRVRPLLEEVT